MSETFDLATPGTPESQWATALAEHQPAPLDLSAYDRIVVVAAHPDDETLGAGGLMLAAQVPVEVVVLTDGAASHPDSATWTATRLAAARVEEVRAAVRLLNPQATTTTLGLPDGRLADHLEAAVSAIVRAVGADAQSPLVLSPWHADRHPDHAAAAAAAAIAAQRTDAVHLGYPIWAWHWCETGRFPWEGAHSIAVPDRAAKRAAVRTHVTQVEPLSDRPGDECLLDPRVLAHFDRDFEILLPQQPATDHALDAVHRDRRDPWNVDDSWYEERKRALSLAFLGRPRYRQALEVGASIGTLATALAERCDRVIAVDKSPTAVKIAADRTPATVEVLHCEVPEQWPEGLFDLVVLSEVGYFLGPRRWEQLLHRVARSLTEDGEVLLCHWKPQPAGWPMDGARVHQLARATLTEAGRSVVARYEDTYVLIELIAGATASPETTG
ncbi:PIG-L family deacetylase [Calidifontibacter terrae]